MLLKLATQEEEKITMDKITSHSSSNSVQLVKMEKLHNTKQIVPFLVGIYAAFSFSGAFPLHLPDHVLLKLWFTYSTASSFLVHWWIFSSGPVWSCNNFFPFLLIPGFLVSGKTLFPCLCISIFITGILENCKLFFFFLNLLFCWPS